MSFSSYLFEGEIKVVVMKTVPNINITCQVWYKSNEGNYSFHESEGSFITNVNFVRK